eukprot:m.27377 g.27377  ORF g.27377 m.27377 type:complete len:319 (+) comp15737_c0_seq1:182-1138(+)
MATPRTISPLFLEDEHRHLLGSPGYKDGFPNDLTSWQNKTRTRKSRWFTIRVKLIMGYMFLFILLTVGYFVSPDKSLWSNHTDECPAQLTECTLLDTYSYEIQGALACTISIVLMTSWLCERPRRPFIRFMADNSKSVFAAMITHFLCGGSAIAIDNISPDTQQCDWYFIIFVWDSLIGVSLTLMLHQWSAHKAANYECTEAVSRIGDYNSKPDVSGYRRPSTNRQRFVRWLFQLGHWIGCAILCRAVDFGLLYLVAKELGRVATGVGWWACSGAQVEIKLWMNILCFPMLLDACQFTIQNHFLKMKTPTKVDMTIAT